jgi:hypothetical protein
LASGTGFSNKTITSQNVEKAQFNGNGGGDNLTITGGPPVEFTSSQHFESLTLSASANAKAFMQINGGNVLFTRLLTVGSGATLDLNDNDMIVDYDSSSPAATIQGLINSGRNGGSWDGAGITSTIAKENTNHNATLGLLEGAEYRAVYGIPASFDGETVDATMVLVKYTYYGDTEFNGRVNFDDYVRTDAGFNNHRSGWLNGDFDANGTINVDDYVLIDLGFNTQSGILGPGGGGSWADVAQMDHFSTDYMYYLIDALHEHDIYLTEADFYPG